MAGAVGDGGDDAMERRLGVLLAAPDSLLRRVGMRVYIHTYVHVVGIWMACVRGSIDFCVLCSCLCWIDAYPLDESDRVERTDQRTTTPPKPT